MAQYGSDYGRQTDEYGNPIRRQTDEYGNPVRQTDEYGNPVQHGHGGNRPGDDYGMTGGMGTGTHGTMGDYMSGTGTGIGGGMMPGQHQQQQDRHGAGGGILRRSGSSSSSSSEDDGLGGRRKKGLKEKIKEKLPGGQKHEEQYYQGQGQGQGTHYQGQGQGTGYSATGETYEKKGIMDKIKDKLPGSHNRP